MQLTMGAACVDVSSPAARAPCSPQGASSTPVAVSSVDVEAEQTRVPSGELSRQSIASVPESVTEQNPDHVQQGSGSSAAAQPPTDLDGKDATSGLYRLKVVGIPSSYLEDKLRSLFQLCGSVAEARIVHDKQSGRPVGYGYVSFFTKEAADLAISTFDDQLQLQGAATYLSVYYAKKQHDTSTVDKESCPARNAKLYFCGTPAGLRRDSILALFSAFGRVRHLQVYTDSYGVLSSGTVTMYSTEEAIAAMNNLDGKVLHTGTAPLKVTWAQLSTLPRRHPGGGGPPPPMPRSFTVSYACVPTSVTPAEVASMFERFGTVLQVVPFAHRREGPSNSRGCGLVVMDSEAAAMAALEALSGAVTWPGAERPLLVQPFYGAERLGPPGQGGGGGSAGNAPGGGLGEYMGPSGPTGSSSPGGGGQYSRPLGGMLQQQQQRGPTNHNMAAAAGPRGHRGCGVQQQQHQHHQQQQQQPYGGAGAGAGGGGGRGQFSQQQQQHRAPTYTQAGPAALLTHGEDPPPGCAPGSFKLMLTNLPASYSQADIFSLLQPYGTVVSLTHVPAGEHSPDSTAAVWYANAAQADAALAALSNTVLMAAEGSRQLALTAFKGRAGPQRQHSGHALALQHHPAAAGQQQQHHAGTGGNTGGGGGGGGLWPAGPAAGMSTGTAAGAPAAFLLQQQQQQPAGGMAMLQQQMAYAGSGIQQQHPQQQQVIQGDPPGVWMTGAGSAGPQGVAGLGAGGVQGQLAALAAVTAAMSSNTATYSMQQLLNALPGQQQLLSTAGWPACGSGNVMLSGSSNLDASLQAVSTGDGGLLGPAVSAAAAARLMQPSVSSGGAAYTDWLG